MNKQIIKLKAECGDLERTINLLIKINEYDYVVVRQSEERSWLYEIEAHIGEDNQ